MEFYSRELGAPAASSTSAVSASATARAAVDEYLDLQGHVEPCALETVVRGAVEEAAWSAFVSVVDVILVIDLAFAARGIELPKHVREDLPRLAKVAVRERPESLLLPIPEGEPHNDLGSYLYPPTVAACRAESLMAAEEPPETPEHLAAELLAAVPRLRREEAVFAAVRAFHRVGHVMGEGALTEALAGLDALREADAEIEEAAWKAAEPERVAEALAAEIMTGENPPADAPVLASKLRRQVEGLDSETAFWVAGQAFAIPRARIFAAPESESASPVALRKVEPTTIGENPWRRLNIAPRLRAVDFDPNVETVPPSWLVKGIVTKVGLGLLFGESAAGKTFLAIHLALCVAWGLPFFGRKVKQGGVVYVAAEGGASVLVRFKAAEKALDPVINAENLTRRAQGLPPLQRAPIRVITEAPNLSRDGSAAPLVATVEDAADAITAQGHRLALVIGDTWHAMLAGAEENSAADTGEALRPLREMSEAEGFTTLFLHHPGKDLDRGARGSNALPAAMDTMIELRVPGFEGQKPKSGATRRVTVVKVRDGEAGAIFSYRLPVVQVGVDEDGEPWTTCVVEPVNEPSGELDGLSATDRDLMAAFERVATEGRADFARMREAFRAGRPKANPEAVRKAFRRAFEAAIRAERLAVDADERWVSLP